MTEFTSVPKVVARIFGVNKQKNLDEKPATAG
jgi:hypothetical protein